MFSNVSFARQIKTLIFGIVLTCLIVLPKTKESVVQAADVQKNNMMSIHGKRIKPNVVMKDKDKKTKTDIHSATLFLVPQTINLYFEEWKSWDVVPPMSQTAHSIYRRGLAMGNNPHAFSKIGDGEISAAWFLTDFDLGTDYYDLGNNVDLQTTIDYFAGSFSRQSLSACRGFNTQRILDKTLADPELCLAKETPLDCEIRLHRPSFALISMGTNQVWQPEQFESGMREVIEMLISQGVVPVLSTKADNLEGDDRINLIIARLAVEYDLPLWNFWRAVQSLPNNGLQEDNEHLTYYPNDFDDPSAMQFAWSVRNLSALRVLEKLMSDTNY